jgi:predicted nuclease with TOPRIM domain
MASTSTYDISFEKLQTLQRSARGMVELTLPERPSNSGPELYRYLNSSISMLSESAISLHGNHHYLDSRLDRIETQIEKLDRTGTSYFNYLNRRFDKDVRNQFDKVGQRFDGIIRDVKTVKDNISSVEKDVKAVKDDVKAVKDDVKAVKDDVKAVKDDVKAFKDDVNHRFDEMRAMTLNGLARMLHARIEKFAAPVRDGNQTKYQVPAGFPKTVKRFWLLQQDRKYKVICMLYQN